MSPTLLTTPLLAPLLRGVAVLVSRLLGWKLAGKFPNVSKAVIIGAPHTSNWDFLVMLMAILVWRLDVHWIGKHSLFIGPLGPVMRWLGGIPVDRGKSQSLVEQMVKHFQERDRLLLVIAPEGTRKPVERWHTGFYRIARQANVPIVLSFMDYRHKEAGVAGVELPGDGMKEDIDRYQDFYTTKTGKNPHNYYGYKSAP